MNKTFFSAICLTSLLACDAELGFDIEEPSDNPNEPENSTRFIGPTEGSSWTLALSKDSDKKFTLTKRVKPNDDKTYDIQGAYKELDNGLLELTLSSTIEKPNEVKDNTLYALRVGDRNVFFLPFESTGQGTILALSAADSCPGSATNLNWIALNESATAAANTSAFAGSLKYSPTTKKITYPNAVSITQDFNALTPAEIDTVECNKAGFAQSTTGNHYLSSSSTIIETTAAPYRRFIAQAQAKIEMFDELHSNDYVGIFEKNGSMSDVKAISAQCTDTKCEIIEQEKPDNFTTFDVSNIRYTLDFDTKTINDLANGFIQGTVGLTGGAKTPVICAMDAKASSRKFMSCVGQNPAQATNSIYFVMSAE